MTEAGKRLHRAMGVAVLLLGTMAPALRAQENPGGAASPTLTLEDAIELALRNNPAYLATRGNESVAEWGVRQAYGAFLPSASLSGGLQYQASGQARFGVFTSSDIGLGTTPSYYSSDYSLSLGLGLSGSDIFRIGEQKANRNATEAETAAARFDLRSQVTSQYLSVLMAKDAVDLARQTLDRAEENLKLARARVEVGVAIPLESMQAEVERGRAQVDLIRTQNVLHTEKLRLAQQIGVDLPEGVELTSTFQVFDPTWTREELVAMALSANPSLHALQARKVASDAGVRMAKSSYLPSLSLSVGWSGYAREAGNVDQLIQQSIDQTRSSYAGQRETCQLFNAINARLTESLPNFPAACDQLVLTPEEEASIRNGIRKSNDVFPFDFTSQPMYARLSFSLPLFQGFSRQLQVETARVQAQNARYQARGQELKVRADVAATDEALTTAARVFHIEERNSAQADEQLRLARERYRVGAASFVELMEAETIKAQADTAYLNAVYTFHQALAALEAAVGRPLRP